MLRTMKYWFFLFGNLLLLVVLLNCNSGSKAQIKNIKHLDYLMHSTAMDFKSNQNVCAVDFRNVNLSKFIISKDTSEMICGEFLNAESRQWIGFVCLKTIEYEFYIGNQAKYFCQNSELVKTDLEEQLKEMYNNE